MLTGADADGDGRLDYGELANIDPDLYIDVLGLKDAESMLRKFDKNKDGHIDAHERRELIKGLIPKLKEETVALREAGEFVASGVLWQNRRKFMESLRESHVKDVEHSQKAFEQKYFDTVEDEEGEPVPGRGFDVTGRPHRLVDASGDVHERVFVLGLQLASVQWGTAIAAEAGRSPDGRARTLGDADAAARAVVSLASAGS